MKEFFKDLKQFFVSKKIKKLHENMEKYVRESKKSAQLKTSKTIIEQGVNVTISAETKKLTEEVKNNVTELINKTELNPEELLKYVQAAKTPVYRLPYADKILLNINEEPGIIYEKEGWEALYLSFITGEKLRLRTPAMFILPEGEIEKYFFLHSFYRWYSLKSGLPGFDCKSQRKLKKYIANHSKEITKTFNLETVVELEEAIARDQEATAFVLAYMKKIEGAKNVLDKMKNEGGANI